MKSIKPISFFLILLFAGLSPVKSQFLNEQGLKFIKLFSWIESYYVDSVDLDAFSDKVIRDMLHKLDPHSAYLSKEEVKETNEQLQGNFEGIGISFNILNDTIIVISTVAGGPSSEAGIKAGDRIIAINNVNVTGSGITNRDILSKLRGRKGTTVSIKVLRKSEKRLIGFSVVRDVIPLNSVDAYYKVDKNTGYIRLSRFSITTMKEILDILSRFKEDNIVNLIVDLSGNGGGYLEVAVSLADEFIDSDKLLVYTKGVHSEKKEYFSTIDGAFEKGKLVIIIDENSASASEIVAGAIQDWDRGIIVGRRSFGKGLVQRQLGFPDGTGLRLTVARYYTPSGRLIQKSYSEGFEVYSKELRDRIEKGELLNMSNIKIPDSLKYYTMMRKRVVYGGGGIIPDIFVPIDTLGYSGYYRSIVSRGVISGFALNYVDNNREYLIKQYPVFQDFKENFRISSGLLDELNQFAKKSSIEFKREEFEKSKENISSLLKANIASDLWGHNAFYEIVNQNDESFIKALDVIYNWDNYTTHLMP